MDTDFNKKMVKKNLIIAIVLFCSSIVFAQNQEQGDKEIPPGMEIIKIGGANVLVPEGTRARKKGGLIILESTSEYTGRKVLEIEKRIDRLEAQNKELQENITILKSLLAKMGKKDLVSPDNEKSE